MTTSVIVAVAHHGVIGYEGGIPWHLPEDLRYFKQVTFGHTMVMGRKTYESIGRPLPGRRNVVISRQPTYTAAGVEVVSSLEQALLQKQAGETWFVIGGQALYQAAMPIADKLYLTEVDLAVSGDTFFPAWNRAHWELKQVHSHATDTFSYHFKVFERLDVGQQHPVDSVRMPG